MTRQRTIAACDKAAEAEFVRALHAQPWALADLDRRIASLCAGHAEHTRRIAALEARITATLAQYNGVEG